jgi:multidrug efflux pump subunit AcrB
MLFTSEPNEECPFSYLMLFSVTTAVGSLVDAAMLVIEAPAHRVSLKDPIAAARKRWASRKLILIGRRRFI